MGRGLGPTQQRVLDYLQHRWANPSDPTFVGVYQPWVGNALATTHSEAQAIRRAIRSLKDRKLIGIAFLRNDWDCWLVPVGEGHFSLDPRPRSEGKMAELRGAITAQLQPSGWQPVVPIRNAVLGPRPDGGDGWDWDRRRQLFNRAIKQLSERGEVVAVGSTNKADQSGWQIRRPNEADRAFRKAFDPACRN